ncbi:protransforming growth factor alpha [Takifugu rubripes]|uniref:Transforming growth factor, alpha n=1 Tax=Takifugu rubripes TaxID=31033 RepID=A0A3B5KKY2_TAKRU|nr:uncharacterized protein LOC101076984 [Takifugu rubripes]
MMTRMFWDTIFLISGSLFTLGAGPSNSTVVKPPQASSSTSGAAGDAGPPTTVATVDNVPPVQSFLFATGAEPSSMGATEARIPTENTFTAALSTSTSNPAATAAGVPTPAGRFFPSPGADLGNMTAAGADNAADTVHAGDLNTSTTAATTTATPVKKFVAAAVRAHFDECPDSHRHFCFHGSCRFLILEETPACVCHPGFIGMRCEHADLLAVVATNHKQTVTTVLVLCVIGCVLVMLLCMLLHCWWRQECRRRRQAHHYCPKKHGVSFHPSESVV